MTDPTPVSKPKGDHTGTPRWVKVFGIITLIVILLFIILQLIGGVEHGPGQHIPSGGDIGGHIWLLFNLQASL